MLGVRERPATAPEDRPRRFSGAAWFWLSAALVAAIGLAGTWLVIFGEDLPTEPAVEEPADIAGPALLGYARTPEGALLAASVFLEAIGDPNEVGRALAELTVPDLGQERALIILTLDPAEAVGTGGSFDPVGYTFLSTTEDVVVVSVALRAATTGDMVSAPLTMRWVWDTWLLQLPESGYLSDLAKPLATLDGYQEWPA